MKCTHCKQPHKRSALNRWVIRLCANQRRKRVFHLCDECDVALNFHMLNVMGDPKAQEKIDRYRAAEVSPCGM